MPEEEIKKTCFVVMPFGGLWDDYYEKIYEPAICNSGLTPVRADDAFKAGSILQDIVNLLVQSTLVLADIAENNRNVHYELGLAHALGKPTILLSPSGSEMFFDVNQERTLTYDRAEPFWAESLKSDISRAISETVAKPESAIPTAFMHIKPARPEADEVMYFLRRIDERLSDLRPLQTTSSSSLVSPLKHKMKGLPETRKEAEKLLNNMLPEEAVQKLINSGIGRSMAESAVWSVAKNRGQI